MAEFIFSQLPANWVALTLETNIGVTPGFYVPAARQGGAMVTLCGAMINNTGGIISSGTQWASLPNGLTPSELVGLAAGSGLGSPVTVTIDSVGKVEVQANIPYLDWVALDGLSFRPS